MRSVLGFRLHKGIPDLPTKLRAYTSSMLLKDDGGDGERHGINNYTDHNIAKWYGISFKLRWFIGVWVFGDTSYPSEQGPIPR